MDTIDSQDGLKMFALQLFLDIFLDPVGSLVSTLWVVVVVGGWVTLFLNL